LFIAGTIQICIALWQAKYDWDLQSMVNQHEIERKNETKQVRCP
jgi:hypothetical protein